MTGKTGCGAAGRAMTALLCAAALTVYGAAAAQAVPAPAADSSYSDADGTTWYVYTTNRSADIAGQSGDHIQIGSGSGAGPTIYGNVYGASGDAGASGSAVSVDNSTVARKNRRDTKSGSIYGGFAMNGSVIGTAVNVNSSDVGTDIFGGSAKSGDVQDNTVTVAGSSARYIYGGSTDRGSASGNAVSVNSSDVSTDISGGTAKSGDAQGNAVTVSGSNVNGVYGGRTDGGSASGNTVTVESSTVSFDISGGTAKSGDAHENVVTATNSTVKSVYGGYASGDSGNALSNEVILENVSVLQDVHGGVALYGSASGNAVTVSSTDVKIYQIYGGAVESGDAENNKVTLGNAEAGFIYGGYSQKSGDVKNNEVTLHGSSADYILAGGLAAGSGDVSGNSLTLENSDSENFAAGGLSMRGNAVGNSVNLSGSRATIVLGAFVAASGDVSGNTAALENSTASSLIGGRTVRGAAVSNGVTVRNSTVSSNVWGGYSVSGTASYDTVTAESADIAGSVYGSFASGEVTGSSVTVTGSDIGGSVYGGYSQEGSTSQTVVNLQSGTVGSESAPGSVYAGYAGSETGSAVNGTINLYGSFRHTDLYGGGTSAASGSTGDLVTGNTLNVYNKDLQALSARNFETLNFYLPAGTGAGDTVLTLTGDGLVLGSGRNINVALTSADNIDKSEPLYNSDYFTLLSGRINKNGGQIVTPSEQLTQTGLAFSDTALEDVTWDYDVKADNAEDDYIRLTAVRTDVYGRNVSDDGSAENNDLTLDLGTREITNAYGSRASGTGTARNSHLAIQSGTISGSVCGAASESGDVENTTLDFTGSAAAKNIYGVRTVSGLVNGTTVNLKDRASAQNVYGVYTENGSATDAVLNLEGGSVGTASDPGVICAVFAADGTGNATNGTMNLNASYAYADLYGGGTSAASGSTGDLVTGNTLNVYNKDLQALSARNFETLNFYLPAGTGAGDTVLTLTGSGLVVPSSGITVNTYASGGLSLSVGDEVTLLSGKIDASAGNLIEGSHDLGTLTIGVSKEYTITYVMKTDGTEDDYIRLKPVNTSGGLKSQTKSLAETAVFTSAMAAGGADALVNYAMDSAEIAARARAKWLPFASMGYSSMLYDSGSHIDAKGWNLNLGVARRFVSTGGELLVGPFFEYGRSSYDSYSEGIHADGSGHFTGGGIFVRQKNNNGFYYEGSVRGGRAASDYKTDAMNGGTTHEEFDYDTNYWGFHAGIGRVFDLKKNSSLNAYLRYFYTHQNDFRAPLSTGETYEFDDVTSSMIRVGARWSRNVNGCSTLYAGLAYQYEFDHEATAYFDGDSTLSPSLEGSSGMLELGWQVLPKKDGNMTVDVGIAGWAGKKRGVKVHAGVKWDL